MASLMTGSMEITISETVPDTICPCAGTMYALAAMLGTATINGHIYDYNPANDSLVKRKAGK